MTIDISFSFSLSLSFSFSLSLSRYVYIYIYICVYIYIYMIISRHINTYHTYHITHLPLHHIFVIMPWLHLFVMMPCYHRCLPRLLSCSFLLLPVEVRCCISCFGCLARNTRCNTMSQFTAAARLSYTSRAKHLM